MEAKKKRTEIQSVDRREARAQNQFKQMFDSRFQFKMHTSIFDSN